MSGALGVLESARFIVSQATRVKVHQEGIATAAKLLLGAMEEKEKEKEEKESVQVPSLQPQGLSTEETLEWIFLLDTLNFCFWSDEPTLFTVSYRYQNWTGYRSLCAALCKAVESGHPVYKPSFYGAVTLDQLKNIFCSETHVQLPLLVERRNNLHEAAATLNEKFSGKVSELIHQSGKSAQKLVHLLVQNFPSFCDTATYNGKTVSFFKRAQIFAADVWSQFGGKGFGEFYDIDSLTMFADYRVPQGLLYLGVLEYERELMQKLERGVHLEAGSAEEVEIRGCTIWAVELIRQKMESQCDSKTPSEGKMNSVLIDYYLWNYAKRHGSQMAHLPIHRTLTVFY